MGDGRWEMVVKRKRWVDTESPTTGRAVRLCLGRDDEHQSPGPPGICSTWYPSLDNTRV